MTYRWRAIMAQYGEFRIAHWEKPNSAEAKIEVASLIGSILLEWHQGWRLIR
jgi:hypothetical protein